MVYGALSGKWTLLLLNMRTMTIIAAISFSDKVFVGGKLKFEAGGCF